MIRSWNSIERIPSVFSKSFNALSPHVRDSTSGILIGAVIDVTRRIFDALDCTVTATFESGNEAFEWISEWLAQQPGYTSSRDFRRDRKPRTRTLSSIAVPSPGMSALYSKHSAPHNDGSLAQYLPSHGIQPTLDVLWFTTHASARSRMSMKEDYGPGYNIEKITLTCLVHILGRHFTSLSKKPPKNIVPETLQKFKFISEISGYGNWRRLSSKPHRDFGSVVLEPEVKRQLLEDANEFLGNERWYADRGIPYRRGYLLYGHRDRASLAPFMPWQVNSGWISTLSLSLKTIDDSVLADLISNTPDRCILLYEDIDAAFIDRSTAPPVQATNHRGESVEKSGVTLSGLLNTIDGVQAQEGRLLFATTNHPQRLILPCQDLHATRWQAEQLFRLFYPAEPNSEKEIMDNYAKEYADTIPPGKFSVAHLQGYLMRYKGQRKRQPRVQRNGLRGSLLN
ncbi:P-loop containing nucleoside triphosphate hydrolase protein [Rhizoctonia solani]|uniref:P-loop containing nucleoside triphosphate hydrolase protein n=1 Tax=Rhizoctonia solani TaxID=456999 RepID=A0A8H7I4E0_9AGAM|nr:P-loop containing nucleoside triphosphate hydrolase protein [Rhizoctonia solani]